jgi:hypothetical protein
MKASEAFWWVLSLFACLVLLTLAGIWDFAPFWSALLSGSEAQGVVYAVRDCGKNDDGDETYQETMVFRDAQGQLQETTSGADCASDFAPGDTVAIWYLPSLPGTSIPGEANVIVFLVFSAIYLVCVVFCLVVFLRRARALLRACALAEAFGRLWLTGLVCLLMVVPLPLLLHFFPPPSHQDGNGPSHNFLAGETVAVDGRWAVSVQPGRRAVQSAGTVCLELDVTLRNTTRQTMPVAASQFTLFDGQARALATACSVDTPKLSNSQVAPGAVITGALAFKVPTSLRACYLAFRPGTPEENTGRYFWRLQVTPTDGS